MYKQQIIIPFHSDPGHGWGEVLAEDVPMGVRSKISGYSYVKGGSLFLEEDCDLPLVVNYFKLKGLKVSFKELDSLHDDHPIRQYKRHSN